MAETIEILFGRLVRRYREKVGLSQEDFADVAGIHRTYVSSIERGKVQVSIGVAQKLSVALSVPLSRLWKDLEQDLGNASSMQNSNDNAPEEPR